MKAFDIIASTLQPDRYIIQFSPIRTGSTLMYNILLDLFPDKKIKKAHSYEWPYRRLQTICTIRHPLDCIVSTIKTKNPEYRDGCPDDGMFRQSVREFDNSGVDDILKLMDRPNVHVFKYEDFINDLEPVYDVLEQVFGRTISQAERAALNEKHNIEAVAARASALGDFSNWDPVTHLHGNHISDTMGRSDVYKDFLSAEQITELKNHYQTVMSRFGYV